MDEVHAFVIAFLPIVALIFGAYSLWRPRPDRWDAAMVSLGAVGAAALFGMDVFALRELADRPARADRGLITLGVGVGVAFVAFYAHAAHKFLRLPVASSSRPPRGGAQRELAWSAGTSASATALPLTLRASPLKWSLMLALCLVLAAAGVWMASEHAFVGYACAAFFGLCALVACVNLHPRSSYLVLDAKGFTFASLFRKRFVPWSQVQGFFPIRVSGTSMVGWNFTAEFADAPRLRQLSTSISGAEAALPDTYGKPVDELAQLLESFRSTYGH